MHEFLTKLNNEVLCAEGVLSDERQQDVLKAYLELIAKAEIECPEPEPILDGNNKPTKRRQKRSKARNLLERLKNYCDDVLKFMTEAFIPFTNNQGERDIRMAKVHQKISECFRSMTGAEMFCRIRSYISTCQKHGLTVVEALETLLMKNTYPKFILNILDSMKTPE